VLSREEIIAADPEAFRQEHIHNVAVAEENLLDVKAILDSAHIQFWLWFGTFWGVYRDRALLPFDGDTDIAISAGDFPRLARCESIFTEKGFKFCLSCVCRNHEHTDFSVFYPYAYNPKKWIAGPLEVDASAFETLNTIEFLGQQWRILSDPERWLTYLYGNKWRTLKGRDIETPGIPHGAQEPIQDHGNKIRAFAIGDSGTIFIYESTPIALIDYPNIGNRWLLR